MKILHKIINAIRNISSLGYKLEKIQQTLGRIEQRQLAQQNSKKFNDNEMQVFSQWGEDGLIQYLINEITIERPIFVEFGVEKYTESNTRFLLCNNNWSGLVIDGSQESINYIKEDPICWHHDLKTECAFIDKDNINELIQKHGISGDIGLLSVDIDGNDYWVWQAINIISPRIVVCEYNSLWGSELAVSVPYDPVFERNKAHFSNLYFGASIKAFTQLAVIKGYSLIGSNIAGNNVFYVRNDLVNDIDIKNSNQAYIKSKFKESRDEAGALTFLNSDEGINLIKELPLVNLEDNKQYSINTLYCLS